MGVESDRLVFDYLSRVGDLAQTALPAAQRMQLVARLRDDIDSRRGGSDSPAAVRRILGRIGTPDEVVEAAAAGGGSGRAAAAAPPPAADAGPEPSPGAYGPYAKGVPGPRRGGRDEGEPEWWRVDRRADAPRAGDEIAGLPGMTGGIFISFDDEGDDEGEDGEAGDGVGAGEGGAGGRRDARSRPGRGSVPPSGAAREEDAVAARPRRTLPRLGGLRRLGTGWGSPMLLIAAGLLIAGAAVGSLVPLGLGWGAAYISRSLTRTQAKFAVLGIPAAAGAALVVWVWGRDTGHWGAPIPQGHVGHAFQQGYPVAIRLAAAATAAYLLHRARRRA